MRASQLRYISAAFSNIFSNRYQNPPPARVIRKIKDDGPGEHLDKLPYSLTSSILTA